MAVAEWGKEHTMWSPWRLCEERTRRHGDGDHNIHNVRLQRRQALFFPVLSVEQPSTLYQPPSHWSSPWNQTKSFGHSGARSRERSRLKWKWIKKKPHRAPINRAGLSKNTDSFSKRFFAQAERKIASLPFEKICS